MMFTMLDYLLSVFNHFLVETKGVPSATMPRYIQYTGSSKTYGVNFLNLFFDKIVLIKYMKAAVSM